MPTEYSIKSLSKRGLYIVQSKITEKNYLEKKLTDFIKNEPEQILFKICQESIGMFGRY